MIAEPGILSTSTWNSDILLKDMHSDFYKPYGLDMGFPILDFEGDRCRSAQGGSLTAFGSSGSPSSASSDCSEELGLDLEWPSTDSASLHIPDHDYLNSSLNLLDGNGVSVCLEEFDWGTLGNNFAATGLLDCGDSTCADLLRSPSCSRPRCSRPVDPVTDTKLWSRMSIEDKVEAVQGLTGIISNQMGLREQLDIIRIIEPSAQISATQTEFVIDLQALDDRKLSGVRDYVRRVQMEQRAKLEKKHTSSPTKVTSCASASASSFTSGKSRSVKGGHCSGNNSSSSSTAGAQVKVERGGGGGGHSSGKGGASSAKGGPSLAKRKHTKKEAKEKEKRAPPVKVVQKRQRKEPQPLLKEQRQLLKERRSGLFRKEEVLSLSELPVIEDVDIDILD